MRRNYKPTSRLLQTAALLALACLSTRGNEPAFRTDECNVLLAGSDGSLWVGTNGGGLMCYREGRFETYGRPEGLPTDVVNGL